MNIALEDGINWCDPRIGIDWGVMVQEDTLSEKDAALPFLADFDSPFDYDGAPMELKPSSEGLAIERYSSCESL